MTARRYRRSPLRVALYTFGAVVLLGIVLGVVVFVLMDDPRRDSEAAGERFGAGLAQLSMVSAVIAYAIQWKRTRE